MLKDAGTSQSNEVSSKCLLKTTHYRRVSSS